MPPTKPPPGPRRLGPGGSHRDMSADMIAFGRNLRDRYGDVASFRIFHYPCAMVFDPELAGRILTASKPQHRKPFDLREMRVALGHGLLTADEELWQRQRRLIQPAFHNRRIHGWGPLMVRRTDAELDRWPATGVVDVHHAWMRVTVEIVAEAMFGADVSTVAARVAAAVDDVQTYLLEAMTAPIPLPLAWPTPSHQRLQRATRTVEAIVDEMIAARRTAGPDADAEDLLGALLAARDDDGNPMPDRQIRDEVLTIFLAGHETTALALSWALYLLASHPDVAARLADEVDAVLGTTPPEADTVPALTYTRAVIDETMRLYPPAWTVGRELIRDVEAGAYTLKAGTQVYLMQVVTHRDARWFREPEAFRPERWLNGETADLPRYAYFPFGGGPRACIGAGMAVFEAVLLLARFAQQYRVTGVAQATVEWHPAVTLRPRNGLRLHVVRRNHNDRNTGAAA